MPIFEYACDECESRFEKLVRRVEEVEDIACPKCQSKHLTTQYSTFAARSAAPKSSSTPEGCGAGACGSGFCGSGMCGMN